MLSIPKPLVQANQIFIVVTVVAALIFHKALLFLPFLVGIYTLLNGKNPVIQTGRKCLKKPAASYPQEDQEQQIFNQWIATVFLGLALLFFAFSIPTVAYAFSLMVVIAAGLALLGYCIGCTVRYRYMMWKHYRSKARS